MIRRVWLVIDYEVHEFMNVDVFESQEAAYQALAAADYIRKKTETVDCWIPKAIGQYGGTFSVVEEKEINA